MIEIIPAILEDHFRNVERKIRKVESLVEWIQLDVVDGHFVHHKTWNSPHDLPKLRTKAKIEADLMIVNPELYVDDWIEGGANRIMVHVEVVHDWEEIIRECRHAHVEIGASFNPETAIDVILPLLGKIDSVLLLGVAPGFGHQPFQPEVLEKVKLLHAKAPTLPIEVDGGINPDTIGSIAKAGATRFAAGSYIFRDDDPSDEIALLKKLAEEAVAS
ncbi:MAG: ribulose-phosphate 3-epimerase [Parcubacteria group bacterium]|nr:ribulose-phosphate 3-epimerase [Parcubacteria group bacterium]